MRAALVLCLLVARVAVAAPTLDAARADARTAGKALIVEVGATWCGPCRLFERDVLTDTIVTKMLTTVTFVRYDADVAPGDDVAVQLGITVYPTFVIIDPATGSELERVTGIAPGRATVWFEELIDLARQANAKATVLQQAVAARPDDPAALIALADYERAAGLRVESIGHYRDAQHSPRATIETTARALDAIRRIEEAVRAQRGLGSDLDLVARRPGSPSASAALVRLHVARYASHNRLYALARSHLQRLEPTRTSDIVDAVHAGMLLADEETTLETAQKWFEQAPDDPALKLMMAEVALRRRDLDLATNDARRICDPEPPPGFELRCHSLRVAIAANQMVPPGVVHAMETARAQLEGHAPDRWRDVESLADFGPFGASLVGALRRAAKTCGVETSYEALLTLDLDVERSTEQLRVLAIHGAREAPLDACLRKKLTGLPLAGRPPGVSALGVSLVVEPRDAACDDCADHAQPVPTGGVAYAALGTGALVSRGVGAAGIADVAPFRPIRFFVGGDAHVGVTDDNEASYAAHGLLGIGGGKRVLLQLITGVGVSRHGAAEPFAVDIPIEVRLSLLRPRGHYQLWGRATVVLDEPSRQMQRLGGDETAIGIGVSAPIAGTRVFLGAEVGRSVAGTSSVFRVGLPIGDGY